MFWSTDGVSRAKEETGNVNTDQVPGDLDHHLKVFRLYPVEKSRFHEESVNVSHVEIYSGVQEYDTLKFCLAQDKIKTRPTFPNVNPVTFITNLQSALSCF